MRKLFSMKWIHHSEGLFFDNAYEVGIIFEGTKYRLKNNDVAI